MTSTRFAGSAAPTEDNSVSLRRELERLRLLISRRVLWLRSKWRTDPLQAYQGLVVSDQQADRMLLPAEADEEARFHREDQAAARLTRSLAEMELERVVPPRLRTLSERYQLSRLEEDVLLLCLAPEVEPGFERLYAYVQDEAALLRPTAALVFALAGAERWTEARRALSSNAPLRRWGLVSVQPPEHLDRAAASAALNLDERIAGFLLGIVPDQRADDYRLDARLKRLLFDTTGGPLAAEHVALVERLYAYFDGVAQTGSGPVLNLVGPQGLGQRWIARALCERLGFRLFELDSARWPTAEAEQARAEQLLEREAILFRHAYYVETRPASLAASAPASDIRGYLECSSAPLVVASEFPLRMRRASLTVRTQRPSAPSQVDLWRQALVCMPCSIEFELERLTQQFDLGPEAIVRAVRTARDNAELSRPTSAAAVTSDDLWQACRRELTRDLDGLADRITPCHDWQDLVLPPDLLRQVKDLADQVAHRGLVYEHWGFGAKLGRGRGISALFSGPSGTGKTMAAEVIARHLGLDLFRVNLAGVTSKYIGETEKNLGRVFDAAEQSGAILFFDEADALFGKRSEVKDSHDRYANIEVNYLLQRTEDYRGLAILATNRKQHLDDAFLRRLRFAFDFPFPDAEARARIWKSVLPKRAAVDGLDFDKLARFDVAGGNIRNIAINAAFLAAAQGETIGMDHVIAAARREYTKINRIPLEADFGRVHSPKQN